MSTIHEQAMNHVYQQVLQRLIGHFTRAGRTALQLLVQRIVVAAGGMEQVGEQAGAGASRRSLGN